MAELHIVAACAIKSIECSEIRLKMSAAEMSD